MRGGFENIRISRLKRRTKCFDFGSRSGSFEGPATHKASRFAGGYLLNYLELNTLTAETFIRRFDSAPRLQPSQALTIYKSVNESVTVDEIVDNWELIAPSADVALQNIWEFVG